MIPQLFWGTKSKCRSVTAEQCLVDCIQVLEFTTGNLAMDRREIDGFSWFRFLFKQAFVLGIIEMEAQLNSWALQAVIAQVSSNEDDFSTKH